MRVLFVEKHADGLLDMAFRAKQAKHDVVYYLHDFDRWKNPVGMGLVERVKDWRSVARGMDLIVLGSNDYAMTEFDKLREEGVKVIGGGVESSSWERERLKGMRIMKRCGIAVPPSQQFDRYEEAIKHVEKTGESFACKPCWDETDKSLSYVASEPEHLIYMLNDWRKRHGRPKGPLMLQQKVKGIEFAVGAWFGPHGFAGGWEENFEHKKLYAGDIGPNCGEMGCYSADTEVLTAEGWKLWPDVTINDELATLQGERLVFEKPTKVVSYDVDGKLISWINQSIDVLVTPNHQMYAALPTTVDGKSAVRPFTFITAEHIGARALLKRTAEWIGRSPKNFVCKGAAWDTGIGPRHTADVVVPFSLWAKFLGIWFAEGSASQRQVLIAQSHQEKSEQIKQLLKDFPCRVVHADHGFRISNAAVAREVCGFGRSYEKRVPDYIKNATAEDILGFLDAFALGDGYVQKNGSRQFYTSNQGLADDLQELLLRVGRLGIIRQLPPKRKLATINGRTIYQRRPAYVVYERIKKITGWLDRRDKRAVHYVGKVYCATVNSHVMFVRRNGKPMWCGNTVIRYVRRSKLADRLLKPIEEELHRIGYVGCIDVNAIIDEDGNAWPLEFTNRLGWPAWNISQALLDCDPVEFLHDLASGIGSGRGQPFRMNEIAVGVVLAQGDFPYSKVPRETVCGVPIYCKSLDDIHLCQAMLGEAPHMLGDQIIKGPALVSAGDYVLVCSGSGDTVRKARAQAYRAIDGVKMPSSPFHRVDIGNRLRHDIDGLQSHGYATGMEY